MLKTYLSFNFKFLTVILVIFLNYWFWRIISVDLIVAIMLVILTLSLYELFLGVKSYLKIVIIFFILASILTLKLSLDKNLLIKTNTEESVLLMRHPYLAEGLGKIYQNKIAIFIFNNIEPFWYKWRSNIFSALDLNLYFFASHPRERLGIEEFKKYSFVLLPFFIIGFIFLSIKKSKITLAYLGLATLINSFTLQSHQLGPILFFPLINLCIAFGIILSSPKLLKFTIPKIS